MDSVIASGELLAGVGEGAALLPHVDGALLVRLIEHGLAAAGRYLVMRIALADRPGELARLVALLAELGLNIIDVEHHRTGPDLPIQQVQVNITVATRDPEHRDEVMGAVRSRGYLVEPG